MIGVQKIDVRVPPEIKPSRGARKRAVARVWLIEKKTETRDVEIYVNRIPYKDYFKDEILRKIVQRPVEVSDRARKYWFFATVSGGGISAQAQAVAHGISRALAQKEPDLRKVLKPLGLLRRDPREVERKKYGRRKARKTQQWKKR